MTEFRHAARLIVFSLFMISLLMSLNVCYNYFKQKRLVIDSFIGVQRLLLEQAVRSSDVWFKKRIEEKGSAIDEIEQEIFTNFVEPIHLLENGDAWIYNKDYVIFDKSSDFPESNKGKSIRQIFEIQKELGAFHYDDLVRGVETAGGRDRLVCLAAREGEGMGCLDLNRVWRSDLDNRYFHSRIRDDGIPENGQFSGKADSVFRLHHFPDNSSCLICLVFH